MTNFTTVFLSSTAKDLRPWRDAVAEKLAKSGFHCVRMEDFGALNASPEDACRQGVAESDVFVGLVGHLYGSCPEGSELSFTRIEYEEAKRSRKPRLLFVAHEDFPVSPRLLREETPETSRRQLEFRETVQRELTVERFLETGNLAADVIAALHKLQARSFTKETPRTGAGKVSSDLAKIESLYLAHLVERYRYLDFRGMGISDRVPLRLPLLEMYVPLKARVQTPKGDTWTRKMRLAGRQVGKDEIEAMGERLSEPQPVLKLLRKKNGLVLLGDPGSGKTTFLKSLALALASGRGKSLRLGSPLPVLLPLSAYANAIAKRDLPLQDFFAHYFKDRGFELPLTALLTEKLSRGEVLLLLDGLDEVRELRHRNMVVERVQDFYIHHRGAGNKLVLTSRVVGYREVRPSAEGLAEATLVDFDDEEIEAFVGKWTTAIEKAAAGETRTAREEASREREDLLIAVRGNPGVRSLAANPLLLTILALMKRQGVTLPERRIELYQRYVETLLKHWNVARGLAGRPAKDLDLMDTLRILQPLALWMHETSPGVGLVKEGDLHRELQRIFAERKERDPEKAAHQFLADVRDHTSLLLDRGGRQYGFIHLTFQEYLAAAALAQKGQQEVEPIVAALASHVGEAPWWEVSLLTLGYLGLIQQRDQAAGAVLGELLQRSPGPVGEAAILAGEAVVDMGRGVIASEPCERIVNALLKVMRDDRQVMAIRRAAAGKALGVLGDPRFDPDLWWLPKEPDLGFVEVPAGPFLMGSDREDDPESYESERPRHSMTLPAFWLGRYPATVGQYQAFVAASGYQPEDPRWHEGPSTQPVSLATWYDARAYCRWLGERLRDLASRRGKRVGSPSLWSGLAAGKLQTSLPSEAEWEKAARGVEGLIYPWGPKADANRANYNDTNIWKKSVVGCFPGGASPYGIEELSGNVWEWTRSLYLNYPYESVAARKDLGASSESLRVLRGGASGYNSRHVRCAYRYRLNPDFRSAFIGFRVVLSPFPL
jgi:formylglycine-generating enzyme required for sulfatase activity/energy-coupling factor transporter ATP-binding protein EcfA2